MNFQDVHRLDIILGICTNLKIWLVLLQPLEGKHRTVVPARGHLRGHLHVQPLGICPSIKPSEHLILTVVRRLLLELGVRALDQALRAPTLVCPLKHPLVIRLLHIQVRHPEFPQE